LRCKYNSDPNQRPQPVSNLKEPSIWRIIPISIEYVDVVSCIKIYVPSNLNIHAARIAVVQNMTDHLARYSDKPPDLDPIRDMYIEDDEVNRLRHFINSLEDKLREPRFNIPNFSNSVEMYKKRLQTEEEIKELRNNILKLDDVILESDLKAMKRVLRRLGYLTKDNVVDVKGRVAADVNTSEELVLTEMLFSGFFTDLTTDQIVALMSCFTEVEEDQNFASLESTIFAEPYRKIQDIARRVATVASESNIDIDVQGYVAKFSSSLILVLYEWCQGASFADVCGNTHVFEGEIIRSMRREEEVLRQMVTAAKTIGNSELENKFAEGIIKLKRGIAFAASLYL
jgi:ATP-dependent RNA helicase DOB1